MVMFMLTGSVPSEAAMAGMAVVTTVESSICMNRAQPTSRGNTRLPDCLGAEGSGGGGADEAGEGEAGMRGGCGQEISRVN